MTLNDEVKFHISRLTSPPLIIDDWELIADKLSCGFEWKGSKIAWSEAKGHKGCKLNLDIEKKTFSAKKFISNSGAEKSIANSKGIYYINDSSLDFSLLISPDQFNDVFDYIVTNIPQHHYFFDIDNNWCLVISSEGYADFGFFKSKDINSI